MKEKNKGYVLPKGFVIPTIQLTYQPSFDVNRLPQISNPQSAAEYFYATWDKEAITSRETIRIMVISNCYQVLGIYETASTHSIVELKPAFVFVSAFITNACAVAIAHNQRAGRLELDSMDIEFINTIRRGGLYLGIDLWDYVIVGKNGFYSCRAKGYLDDEQANAKNEIDLNHIIEPVNLERFNQFLTIVGLLDILKQENINPAMKEAIKKICKEQGFDIDYELGLDSRLNSPFASEVETAMRHNGEKESIGEIKQPEVKTNEVKKKTTQRHKQTETKKAEKRVKKYANRNKRNKA